MHSNISSAVSSLPEKVRAWLSHYPGHALSGYALAAAERLGKWLNRARRSWTCY